MSTALFENIVFGPVSSRRLGVSLGVNLLPQHGKLCNFNCIYCECGWNEERRGDNVLPSFEQVALALESRLEEFSSEGKPLDTITFSGNGEPTLHPDFPRIIEKTIELRDRYFPASKVSVLSNATRVWKKEVREALMKVDNPILKLDSPDIEVVQAVNRPQGEYSIETVIEGMEAFKGDFILQTIFFQGSGQSRQSIFIIVLRQVVLLVPLAWVFHFAGLTYVWLTFPVTEVLSVLCALAFYRGAPFLSKRRNAE